jgi:hypothetical protein
MSGPAPSCHVCGEAIHGDGLAVSTDPQTEQDRPLLLWCEAAGMLHQLARIGQPYGVQAVAGGGSDSVTDKWQIVQLVRRARKPFEVLHIGDLDRHG